jgi:hypothetical protein
VTRSLLGVLVAPSETFRAMRGAPAKQGAVPVFIAGALWALFALVLALNGESPTRGAPLIPTESHYAAQAIFVVPLFFVSWLVLASVAGRITGADVAAPLGYAFGIPLATTWMVPDVMAYGVFGFDALSSVVRFVAPITAAYALFLATVALREIAEVRWARAFGAAFAGLLAQALVGAWALR